MSLVIADSRPVTDRPIGATHDRRYGATFSPRKSGLERGAISGLFRPLCNRRFWLLGDRPRGPVAGPVEDDSVGAVA